MDLPPKLNGLPASTVWLECFATAVIAFVVQFNVLPLMQTFQTREDSEQHAENAMLRALLMGIGLPTVVYLTLELLSYFTFGDAPYDKIIEHYEQAIPPYGPGIVGLLGVGQLLSYALLAHAGVDEFSKACLLLARCGGSSGGQTDEAAKVPAVATEKTALKADAPSPTKAPGAEGKQVAMAAGGGDAAPASSGGSAQFVADAIAGIVWVCASTAMAVVLTDVGSLLALVGAVCAMPLVLLMQRLTPCRNREHQPCLCPLTTVPRSRPRMDR